MTRLFRFFITTLFVLHPHSTIADKCPFDDNGNNCDCRGQDPLKPVVFDSIECRPSAGQFQPIKSASKLTVKEELSIMSDTLNITMPANSFIAFESINRISFLNTQFTTIMSISLDQQAFDGVRVDTLSFSGIRDLLPLPQAIINAGRQERGLIRLEITNGGRVRIPADQFDGFSFLESLSIINTHIDSIDDQAFASVSSTLQRLSLSETALSAFPLTALSYLKKLSYLNIGGNNLRKWPKSAFANLSSLYFVGLSQNYLQQAIDGGAFDNFPKSVNALDLGQSMLCKIPTDLLKSEFSQVVQLYLSSNAIAQVQTGDFPENTAVQLLDLSDNPLSYIDDAALQSLHSLSVVYLDQAILSSFDLSSLNGLDKLEMITLDYQRMISFELKVTDASKVPQSLKYVSMQSTNILTLSSDLEPVISRDSFASLNMQRVNGLTCDENINWMAMYAVCPKVRINVDGTTCSNLSGISLRSYLMQQHPACYL